MQQVKHRVHFPRAIEARNDDVTHARIPQRVYSNAGFVDVQRRGEVRKECRARSNDICKVRRIKAHVHCIFSRRGFGAYFCNDGHVDHLHLCVGKPRCFPKGECE